MQRILRFLPLLAALLAAVVGIAACGGKAGDEASSGDDVNTLLTKTFTGEKKLDSGKVDLKLKLNISGGGSQVQGPIDIALSGPFESQGKGKLPKLDLDLAFKGAGQNITAGVTSTGDKGFVNFNGQEYVLSDQIFQQFKQGYEQAAAQGGKDNKGTSLANLGINPRDWLTNPKNEGDAKVGDADVIKITGGVDVGKLLDDINSALAKAGSLGLQGTAQLPTKITDEQKAQVAKAVKDLKVEIYTGKDDSLLRRFLVTMKLDDGESKADITFDLSLLDVNESQEFKAPANAKPFEQLLGQLGGLGLGGLGGSSSGSGSSGGGSSGSSGSGSSGANSAEQLQKYSDCLQDAGQDLAKAQKCAELLG